MKKIIFGALSLSLLVACEEQNVENDVVAESVRVEAEITSSGSNSTRTSTTGNAVTFAEGDQIGFYMPEAEESGFWTLSDGVWVPSTTYVWPDKINSYDFCAYYPFTVANPRTSISMPDLTAQTGEASELGNYDFLVARCAAKYNTANGVVSFTENQAFKHVYSLMSITLKTNADTKDASLTDLSIKANGVVSSHTYHFGQTQSEDGMTLSGDPINEFSLSGLNVTIPTDGYNSMYIVNPLDAGENVAITIKYSRNGELFTASTQVPAESIKQGSLNKLTIRIKKSGLVVEGNTVEDWSENTMDDVEVEENPNL